MVVINSDSNGELITKVSSVKIIIDAETASDNNYIMVYNLFHPKNGSIEHISDSSGSEDYTIKIENCTSTMAIKQYKQTNTLCKNCCHNQTNGCMAHVYFGEEGIHGTDKCPSYVNKNDEWDLIVHSNGDKNDDKNVQTSTERM